MFIFPFTQFPKVKKLQLNFVPKQQDFKYVPKVLQKCSITPIFQIYIFIINVLHSPSEGVGMVK